MWFTLSLLYDSVVYDKVYNKGMALGNFLHYDHYSFYNLTVRKTHYETWAEMRMVVVDSVCFCH